MFKRCKYGRIGGRETSFVSPNRGCRIASKLTQPCGPLVPKVANTTNKTHVDI